MGEGVERNEETRRMEQFSGARNHIFAGIIFSDIAYIFLPKILSVYYAFLLPF